MKIQFKTKWSRKEIILFLERLEMYISAGLSISKVIPLLATHRDKNKNAKILQIAHDFEQGCLLSFCLHKHIGINPVITNMIEYGELSGKLNRSIVLSVSLLTKEDELIKKCLNALLYPVFIGSFSFILTVVLIQKVLSQIIPLLTSLNVDLPLTTKVVIATSQYMKTYGVHTIVLIVLLFLISKYIYNKTIWAREVSHNILVRIPLLGSIIYNYHISLFLQSCGSLIESGLTIHDAYAKSQNAVTFLPIKSLLQNYHLRINEGMPLSQIFRHKQNPHFLQSIISAGESSGSLGRSIMKAHDILDRDLDSFIKKFTVLIEPAMMIFMGLFVGVIAISIMVPIYSISNSLQK